MNDFIGGYVTAMLWANTTRETESGDLEHSDESGNADSLTPEAREAMTSDCRDFLQLIADQGILPTDEWGDIVWPYQHGRALAGLWTPTELAGHDFALTRNGHGAGYWDRGLGEIGETLTKWAKTMGTAGLWVDSEGAIPR